MTPLPRSLLNRQETEALLEAPSDRPVFVAVVAVDRAGNRSPIQLGAGGSVAGPVQALDNLPPSPIEGVLAFDRPNDDGGTITVRWSPSPAADFAEYRVYLSVQPFSEGPVPAEVPPVAVSPARSLTLLDVPAPADGTDLYVAVTARDQTGNESALGPASHFGPVQSFADLPALADAPFSFLVAPVGVVRGSAAFFRWSRTWEGEPVEVFRYRLDGGNARSTRSPEVLLSGLQPGEHVFQVEPAADPSRRLVQRFQVEPLWVPEQEPNEDPVTAQSIAPTVPVRGSLRDSADLDRFRLELLSEGILTVILERQAPGTAHAEVVPVLGSATGEPITRTTVIGLERSLNAVSVGLSAGTYLLQVTGDQGPYQLTVRLSPNHPRFSLEVEPNDRSIEATPFGEGTVELSGSGNRPDDRDWFRLPARDPSAAWELVLLQPLASGSSAVTVWTELPNGERQLFTTATLGPQLSTFRVRSGFQTAALWVEVIPAQEAPYTLLWRPAQDGVPRELEPNDDPSRPTVLNGGERELLGVANRPGDRDWFRLLVPDRETSWELAVQQPLSSGAGTVALWIEAPDGTRLPLAEATLSPEQPTARFRARFQTEALWAEVVPAPEVPYTLSWRPVVDGTIWEREPNDDPTRAVSLSSAEWTYGAISREGDSDLFRLDPSGPASGIGLLSIERIRGEPPTVELQDAFRRPIPFEPVLTTDGLQSGVVWPLAGSLLVRVSAPAGSEYRIGAVRVPDAHHTAERPLGQGESFTVRVAVPADWTVRAELSAARRTVPMSFQDGLWQGTYTVREGDWTQGEPVLLSLEAPSGWRGLLPVGPPVVLDTLPPTILSAEHSAVRALRAGEELRIVVRSEPGLIGRFELQEGNFLVSGVLLDDGAHEDGNPDDGLYVGVYRVQPGDRAEAARVTVLLEDAVGNRAQRELPRPVRLDTTPPLIESVQHNGVEVLTPGARLIVTVRGEPGAQAFFSVPGLRSEVPLYDTGAQDDEVAGDGVYVGATQITPSDPTITELVHVRLTDSAGNVAEAVSSLPVAVDTQGPAIQSVTHNGDRPLRLGERLVVRVVSEPDGTATFDLGTERLQLPLFDDGTGEDETADDGVYTGVYVVQEGDQLTEVPLTVRVRDAYGNETIATAQRRVTLDAIPPPPVLGLKVEDVPNDEGNRLRLSWQPIQEVRDFLRYHVYRERFPIRSVQGLAPVHSELVRPEAATLELEVPSNNVDYYFAITAVDQARNESPLDPSGGSVFGPVRAVDDIPPAPVAGVKAEDVPGDNGRALRVSWTTQNTEPDFAGVPNLRLPSASGRGPVAGAGPC
ncbi:MAG: hypothetical protein KatS3mg115_0142 [Candidatus Poribacteria bacterium]|nr:MAG: hypothetical protein KatS3mg115_0142 [Candidatus Poribacteria bacterium]